MKKRAEELGESFSLKEASNKLVRIVSFGSRLDDGVKKSVDPFIVDLQLLAGIKEAVQRGLHHGSHQILGGVQILKVRVGKAQQHGSQHTLERFVTHENLGVLSSKFGHHINNR